MTDSDIRAVKTQPAVLTSKLDGRLRRGLVSTSATNILSTAAAGITGILIARSMGPGPRGDYAAVMAWFGVILVVGQLGQTTATTYFVAKNRPLGRDYVATSRNLMVGSGALTLIVGIGFAPVLANGDAQLTYGYQLMFATCIASFLGASFVFGLQARDTFKWNLVRVFQPIAFAAAVWTLEALGLMTLMSCLWAISATIVLQGALAYVVSRRSGLTGGRGSRQKTLQMGRYGLSQLAGAVPAVVVARLDVLTLSVSVDSKDVGQYAVAASLTALASPLVSAIGSVILPRLASQPQRDTEYARQMHRSALAITACLSGAISAALMASASWLVPTVFGTQYQEAVILVLILAPGAACLACSHVCSDILRGYGLPLTVAKVQWATAVVTGVSMAVLLPTYGVVGASAAMTTSSCICLTLSLFSLKAVRKRGPHGDGQLGKGTPSSVSATKGS